MTLSPRFRGHSSWIAWIDCRTKRRRAGNGRYACEHGNVPALRKDSPWYDPTFFSEARPLSSPVLFVLVGPRSPGNVGAVCRTVGAFGLSGVRLVCPECDPAHEEARWLAHGAENVLRSITVHDDLAQALQGCSRSAATTARPRNWRRPVLDPVGTADDVRLHATHERPYAIVFGPEDRGLTNDDLSRCDHVLSIPLPDERSATLSLPAAASLVAWELTRARDAAEGRGAETADTLGAAALDDLLDDIQEALDEIGFRARPDRVRFRGTLRDFLARARPTEGDRRLLRHMFAQVGKWKRRVHGEARRGLGS